MRGPIVSRFVAGLGALALIALAALVAPPRVVVADISATPPDKAAQDAINDKIKEGDAALKEGLEAVDEMDNATNEEDFNKALEKAKAALAKLKKLRQEAIDMADRDYKITHPKKLKGEPQYGTGVAGEGVTHGDGSVGIGESAFHDPGNGSASAGWLASSKAHEMVHVGQLGDGTWVTGDPPKDMPATWADQMDETNEVQAYDWEIAHAKDLGLSDAAVAELKRRRKQHYDGLSDENKKKVDAKNYATACEAVTPSAPVAPGGEKKKDSTESLRHVSPSDTAVPGGAFRVEFFGNGTTHSISAHVENQSKDPVVLDVATGTTFVPSNPGVQTMIAVACPPVVCPPAGSAAGAGPLVVDIPAFCTDRTREPPPAGMALRAVGGAGWTANAPAPTAGLWTANGDLGTPSTTAPPAPAAGTAAATPTDIAIALVGAAEVLQEMHQFLPTGSTDASGAMAPDAIMPPRWIVGQGTSAVPAGGSYAVPQPGPYESSHPPSIGWGNARGTVAGFEKNAEGVSGGFGLLGAPVVAQPKSSAPTTARKTTFDDTALLWTGWTLANFGGKPNPQAVSEEAQKQFKAQGVDPAQAKAAGDMVALEIVPVVSLGLKRAQANVNSNVDWSKLDLSLKSR